MAFHYPFVQCVCLLIWSHFAMHGLVQSSQACVCCFNALLFLTFYLVQDAAEALSTNTWTLLRLVTCEPHRRFSLLQWLICAE